jgi:hypothetical protein
MAALELEWSPGRDPCDPYAGWHTVNTVRTVLSRFLGIGVHGTDRAGHAVRADLSGLCDRRSREWLW